MDVGLSTLYDIGSNYAVRINDKEILVYEEDETRTGKSPQTKRVEKENETKEAEKKGSDELSEDEDKMVKDLQARDAEVRAHEAAHQAAGGGMTGAASFTYQQGPDGRMYAIGGEVSISTPSASTPEEAIANARQMLAAAMAPADPSPQDYSVASSARVMEMKAQQQLAREQQEETLGKESYNNSMNSQEDEKEKSTDPLNISA